jgi:hypothetical protein
MAAKKRKKKRSKKDTLIKGAKIGFTLYKAYKKIK